MLSVGSTTTIAVSDTEANDTLVHMQDTPVQRVTAKATHGSQNPQTPLSPSNSTSGPSQSSFLEAQTQARIDYSSEYTRLTLSYQNIEETS